ncbi:hypothetical protein GCM10008018_03630 [Paenibacillus marchantiophytorum]|uniref:Uncharacterized protein n=1 Tax=Paenibacillus marchantiophytorum TaxID=1619310 RepID=A0ABQ2BPS8_9BACL|nr:hypothetical protein [Paenibacillus marchantiophytorum]GGI43740.1 hypothetical protein GCM10008018_03630 [Paenibacillus marchantiophytorum]
MGLLLDSIKLLNKQAAITDLALEHTCIQKAISQKRQGTASAVSTIPKGGYAK